MSLIIWLSQTVNVFLGGMPDEMLSARAYRCRDNWFWGIARVVLDIAFFWQTDHCKQCYEWERQRLDLPTEYRDE